MTGHTIVSMLLFVLALLTLAMPLGHYMARVYQGKARLATKAFGSLERLFYRAAGVKAEEDMAWTAYAWAVLAFNFFGLVLVYALQRLQGVLPLNPTGMSAVPPEVAFNTAVSFASNTKSLAWIA